MSFRRADRRVHEQEPGLRDPRSLRSAVDRIRALPRGRPRRPHDGQRLGVPLHPAVDHDLHTDAHVLGRLLPELARAQARAEAGGAEAAEKIDGEL